MALLTWTKVAEDPEVLEGTGGTIKAQVWLSEKYPGQADFDLEKNGNSFCGGTISRGIEETQAECERVATLVRQRVVKAVEKVRSGELERERIAWGIE